MSESRPVSSATSVISNPCVRNCCLDDDDVCLGCFRTLDEILGWRALTSEQREKAMIEIEKRRIAKAR
jgi:predicted Fe-S protein YdhL (DUF1289 family)